MITKNEFCDLRPMDRVIVHRNGLDRVAQVQKHPTLGEYVRVRLHKLERAGFCCSTTTVRRSDIKEVTHKRGEPKRWTPRESEALSGAS